MRSLCLFILSFVCFLFSSQPIVAQKTHQIFSNNYAKSSHGLQVIQQSNIDLSEIKEGEFIQLPDFTGSDQIIIKRHSKKEGSGSLIGRSKNSSFVLTYQKGKITSQVVHLLSGKFFVFQESAYSDGYIVSESEHLHDDENFCSFEDNMDKLQSSDLDQLNTGTSKNIFGNDEDYQYSAMSLPSPINIDVQLGVDDYYYDYLLSFSKVKSIVQSLQAFDFQGEMTGCAEYKGDQLEDYADIYELRETVTACSEWINHNIDNVYPNPNQILRGWLDAYESITNEAFINSDVNTQISYINIFPIDTTIYHEKLARETPRLDTLSEEKKREYISYYLPRDTLLNYPILKQRIESIGADLHLQITSGTNNTYGASVGTFPIYDQTNGDVNVSRSKDESFVNKVGFDHQDYSLGSLEFRKSIIPAKRLFPEVESGVNFNPLVSGLSVYARSSRYNGGASMTLVSNVFHPTINWNWIEEHCADLGGTLGYLYQFETSYSKCVIPYQMIGNNGSWSNFAYEPIEYVAFETMVLVHEMGHNFGLRHGRTHGEDSTITGSSPIVNYFEPDKSSPYEFTSNEISKPWRHQQGVGFAACARLPLSQLSSRETLLDTTWFTDNRSQLFSAQTTNPVDQQKYMSNLCYSTVMHYGYNTIKSRTFSTSRVLFENTNHRLSSFDHNPSNWSYVTINSDAEWNSLGNNNDPQNVSYIPLGIPGVADASEVLNMHSPFFAAYRTRQPGGDVLPEEFSLPDRKINVGEVVTDTRCGDLQVATYSLISLPCIWYEEMHQFVHPSKLVTFLMPITNRSNNLINLRLQMNRIASEKSAQTSPVFGDGENIAHVTSFDSDSVIMNPGRMTSSGWKTLNGTGVELSEKIYNSEAQSLLIQPSEDTTVISSPLFRDFDQGKIDLSFELFIDADSEKSIDKYRIEIFGQENELIGGFSFDYSGFAAYDPVSEMYQYQFNDVKPNIRKFSTFGATYDPVTKDLVYTIDGKEFYTQENVSSFYPSKVVLFAIDYKMNSQLYMDDFRLYRNQYSSLIDFSPTNLSLESGEQEYVKITIDPSLFDDSVYEGYDIGIFSEAGEILTTSLNLYVSGSDELASPSLLSPSNGSKEQDPLAKLTWEHKEGSSSVTGYELFIAKKPTELNDSTYSEGGYLSTQQENVVYLDTLRDVFQFNFEEDQLKAGTTYLWQVTPIYFGNRRGTPSDIYSFTTAENSISKITLKTDPVNWIPEKTVSVPIYANQKLPNTLTAAELNILIPASIRIQDVYLLDDPKEAELSYSVGSLFFPTEEWIPGTSTTYKEVGLDPNTLRKYSDQYQLLKIAMATGAYLSESDQLINLRIKSSTSGSYRIFPFTSLLNTEEINNFDFGALYFEDQVLGDIDGNGAVQAYDASAILHYLVDSDILDEFPWNPYMLLAADYDNDDQIRATDASRILSAVVNPKESSNSDVNGSSDTLRISASITEGVLSIQNDGGELLGLEVMVPEAKSLSVSDVSSKYMFASNISSDTLKIAIASTQRMLGDIVRFNISNDITSLEFNIYANTTMDTLKTGEIGTNIENGGEIPDAFHLYQNYPNPFNPTTLISFDLPVAERVTLEVFNLTGQRVAILSQNRLFSAGRHTVEFDAQQLATGLYIYRIRAGEFSMVKSMMLIR